MIQNEQLNKQNSGNLHNIENFQVSLEAAIEEKNRLKGQIGSLKKQIKDMLISPSQQYHETEQTHLRTIDCLKNGFPLIFIFVNNIYRK